MDEQVGRLGKGDLHRLVELAEGSSAEAAGARATLVAHFSRTPEAAPPPARAVRKDRARHAERVAAALREMGAAPGQVSVRDVARRAGLAPTTAYRALRELGAPPRRQRARAAPAPAPAQAAAPGVVVVGCGRAGLQVLGHLHRAPLEGARTLAVDTDKDALDAGEAGTKLLVGKTLARGAGAGGDVEVGRRAAEGAASAFAPLFAGAKVVLLCAGLGGGTGTGALPALARAARDAGAVVVALVTRPFHVERARVAKADEGMTALRGQAHTLLALENDRLLRFAPNLPLDQAFRVMDALLASTIRSLLHSLDGPEPLRVLARGGDATLLYGESHALEPRALVREAFAHSFTDADPRLARGALVEVATGAPLSLADAQAIVDGVATEVRGAEIAWSARVVPELGPRTRLSVVLIGGATASRM